MDDFSIIRALGGSAEEHPTGYAVDFHNALVGEPYIEGTGFFCDRETAEGVAAFILPSIDAVTREALADDPSLGNGWTDPEQMVTSWCYIVSAQRDEDDEPAVFEEFHGDVWFCTAVEMPWTMDVAERDKWAKVQAALSPVMETS